MAGSLAGKAALVTGAARGQGRAIALALAEAGADVAICDVGAAAVETVGYALGGPLGEVAESIEAYGRRALAMACDVRSAEQVDAFVAATLEAFGRVDIVINNAGILTGGVPAHELDESMWTTMIDVNLTGAWRVIRAAVPHMIARGQGGRIVNIASVAGHVGTPGYAHYCASKHGVMGLTRAMAGELAPQGITVNALCPGLVDTPMVAAATDDVAAARGISVEEAYELQLTPHLIKEKITSEQSAAAVMYLVSEAARVVTGSALMIDAGWSAT
ncbi:MAG: SDR family NAD(P)-dependent oxidoreductase [Porphyrobacter sp.]|nr:SDR family NAD(P)-dependent oxidoreductase [Porphyrobacter sp.]